MPLEAGTAAATHAAFGLRAAHRRQTRRKQLQGDRRAIEGDGANDVGAKRRLQLRVAEAGEASGGRQRSRRRVDHRREHSDA